MGDEYQKHEQQYDELEEKIKLAREQLNELEKKNKLN